MPMKGQNKPKGMGPERHFSDDIRRTLDYSGIDGNENQKRQHRHQAQKSS